MFLHTRPKVSLRSSDIIQTGPLVRIVPITLRPGRWRDARSFCVFVGSACVLGRAQPRRQVSLAWGLAETLCRYVVNPKRYLVIVIWPPHATAQSASPDREPEMSQKLASKRSERLM